jgi:hypothetical protein
LSYERLSCLHGFSDTVLQVNKYPGSVFFVIPALRFFHDELYEVERERFRLGQLQRLYLLRVLSNLVSRCIIVGS